MPLRSFFKKKKSNIFLTIRKGSLVSLCLSHLHTLISLLHIHTLTSFSFSLSCSCTLLEVLLPYMYAGTQNTIRTKDLC